MVSVTIKELFEAGVHFGHRTQRWNPRMRPYIYKNREGVCEARNGIYLIDLEQTYKCLDEACDFLKSVSRRGQKVLFVGCKKPAQTAVREISESVDCPYVADRWLGGTLTNLQTIRKSVKQLDFIDEIEKNGVLDKYPKQEAAKLRRERAKMLRNLCGIRRMQSLPGALVIVDILREENALAEAKRLNIPVVAIVDTNADPSEIDHVVPGNDDAMRSIRILLQTFANGIAEGQQEGGKTKAEKAKSSSETLEAVSA